MDGATIESLIMKWKAVFLLVSFVSMLNAQSEDADFQNLMSDFESEYSALDLPDVQLAYRANLENIAPVNELKSQKEFFLKYQKSLKPYVKSELSRNERLTLEVLLYEINVNLERIELETQWQSGNYSITGKKIHEEPMGKQWYTYFLKKWVDKELSPDTAYSFGLREIEKVKAKMTTLESEIHALNTKHPSKQGEFLLSDKALIIEKYKALDLKVKKNAELYFPYIDEIPALEIARSTNQAMAIAPAYYSNNTFYFNFFKDTYDSRDMGWIYVHEAIPGHHYQHYINQKMSNPVRNQFTYMGYLEGWGAYVEQFVRVLGAYQSPKDAYAQMEWDLIRSVRVALDVGLNFYGWSDEEAFSFWEMHIQNKPDIAQREIARMKRWPAQVITYKYGKQVLDELKGNRTSPEALKKFHQQKQRLSSVSGAVDGKYMFSCEYLLHP